jgi:hypothetical protein
MKKKERAEHRRVATFRWVGKPQRNTEQDALMVVYPGGFARSGITYSPGEHVFCKRTSARKKKKKTGRRSTTDDDEEEEEKEDSKQWCIGKIVNVFMDRASDEAMATLQWYVRPEELPPRTHDRAASGANKGEIFLTSERTKEPVEHIGEKCRVAPIMDVLNVAKWTARSDSHYWWRKFWDPSKREFTDTAPPEPTKSDTASAPKRKRPS